MVRSSGVPRISGLKHIRKIVQSREIAVTVTSVDYSTNELDETVETENDHTEQLWLYQGTSRLAQELMGERPVGTLSGIATTPIDIQKDDRITYSGTEYDVQEVNEVPDDDPQMVIIGCTERQG